MKKEFSFYYGEKHYTLEAVDNAVYELEKGVTVQVVCKQFPAYDASYWMVYFANNSAGDSQVISNILDCDTLVPLTYPRQPKSGYKPVAGDACVITMKGMVEGKYYWENDAVSATEYNFAWEFLDKARDKTKSFHNIFGRSSEEMMPFFDITANGEGCITAIGWTGDWKASFTKKETGIQVQTGLKETGFYLKAGEKVRTSSVLMMGYTNGEDKHNKFRRLIKNHFSHIANTQATRQGVMACELWGGLPSQEMIKRLDEYRAHDIRFEDVWIDAGWYGQCTNCNDAFSGDWSAHTGEWEVNKRVHPNELRDVRDAAKKAGMNLMLWFEPERAIVGTPVTQQHPEWFLHKPGSNFMILNYGNQEAAEYAYNVLSGYVKDLEMSCYRQDFNVALTETFKAGDEENRRGITEIKHITGMYALWDRLLKAYPHLLIDNCSGGGRRIDIETLQRSIPFFRSDYQCNFNENPEVLQVHNANISCYLPYNGCTSKTKGDTYGIRSSYSSSWGGAFYNTVFQSMDDADIKWAKKITDEYRAIRAYFSADFYNHGSSVFDDTAWAIWQYHDLETNSGIVMAFRRENSPFEQVTIQLKGLVENTAYRYENLDSGALTEGADRLQISLAKKRSSTIIRYTQK